MQKVIDCYFLIVSSVISIISISFCLYDKNLDNILLFCFSIIVNILYIINILKTSAFFRLFVKCVSVLLSVIMAIFLPIAIIMLTFKHAIDFYLAICFCILNIILSLCMKTEVHQEQNRITVTMAIVKLWRVLDDQKLTDEEIKCITVFHEYREFGIYSLPKCKYNLEEILKRIYNETRDKRVRLRQTL